MSGITFEGKLVETRENGDWTETEIKTSEALHVEYSRDEPELGPLQHSTLRTYATATRIVITVSEVSMTQPVLHDGPETRLAKRLLHDYGDGFSWDELRPEEQKGWRLEAQEILEDIKNG